MDHIDLCVSCADPWLSTTLKTSKPNFHQAPLEIKAFPGDRRICDFTYLGISSAHCQITSNKRIVHTASTTPHINFKGRQTKELFIQPQQPHTSISRDVKQKNCSYSLNNPTHLFQGTPSGGGRGNHCPQLI